MRAIMPLESDGRKSAVDRGLRLPGDAAATTPRVSRPHTPAARRKLAHSPSDFRLSTTRHTIYFADTGAERRYEELECYSAAYIYRHFYTGF